MRNSYCLHELFLRTNLNFFFFYFYSVYDASALRVPGWRDEDNVLVKEAGDTVKVYKWSDAQAKWSYEMDALL